jgi:hypothetical protein
LLEVLLAVSLAVVTLGAAFRLAVPVAVHPSGASSDVLERVQVQQAWELLAGEVRWAGWRVDSRALWVDSGGESGRSDALWVRYIDDTYRSESRLMEGYLTAGEDGRGTPNLMWVSSTGWRQPIVRGVSQLQVLKVRNLDGSEASPETLHMRHATWAAVQVQLTFEDGAVHTRWLPTQFRTPSAPEAPA